MSFLLVAWATSPWLVFGPSTALNAALALIRPAYRPNVVEYHDPWARCPCHGESRRRNRVGAVAGGGDQAVGGAVDLDHVRGAADGWLALESVAEALEVGGGFLGAGGDQQRLAAFGV